MLIEAVGQGFSAIAEGVDAQGNPTQVDFGVNPFDEKSTPVTGASDFDAASDKRINDSTVEITRTKAGKVVATIVGVISADGKTLTYTLTGVNPNGQPINAVAVYDKQQVVRARTFTLQRTGRSTMKRRTLTTMTLLSALVLFATALPRTAFAQSNPFFNSLIGTWKLNLAKSTYSPGPPPRSRTLTYHAEGQGIRVTLESVDAQGNTTKGSDVAFDDGKSYPVTGNPAFDAQAGKVVNDSTAWIIRTKAGKVAQTLIGVVSADGKTNTITTAGVTADGRQINDVSVYEKQ
jgi:hypothetical protein